MWTVYKWRVFSFVLFLLLFLFTVRVANQGRGGGTGAPAKKGAISTWGPIFDKKHWNFWKFSSARLLEKCSKIAKTRPHFNWHAPRLHRGRARHNFYRGPQIDSTALMCSSGLLRTSIKDYCSVGGQSVFYFGVLFLRFPRPPLILLPLILWLFRVWWSYSILISYYDETR